MREFASKHNPWSRSRRRYNNGPADTKLETATWRKSSRSGSNGGNCLEIAELPGGHRGVRDSKNPPAWRRSSPQENGTRSSTE
ncbi:DUF397 domain-containing protein [Nonomuraea sp. NPDC050680]|uniref:DUF397 domain-containing protein n=1 Tax=Nonomuraea sp. NPDC050680 TaxID=3154630 RepID=UPI0033D61A6D